MRIYEEPILEVQKLAVEDIMLDSNETERTDS